MNRTQFIQKLIDTKSAKTYLELGTGNGRNFLSIRCKKKYAVDPKFIIPIGFKVKCLLLNPHNWFAHYFQETSENFFITHKTSIKKMKTLDVVFIHSQHSFEASLKVALNALQYLSPDGVIIVHNCFPPNKEAAFAVKEITKSNKRQIEGLCGDVFKSMVYLRTKYLDTLRVRVLETDFGLGVITLKKNFISAPETDHELYKKVDKMTWDEMMEDPEQVIGLVPLENVNELLEELRKKNTKKRTSI